MARKTIGALLQQLQVKSFDNPYGVEVPNLGAMVSNAAYRLTHPGSYTETYLKRLRKDIREARRTLSTLEGALSTLEKRTEQRWKRKR